MTLQTTCTTELPPLLYASQAIYAIEKRMIGKLNQVSGEDNGDFVLMYRAASVLLQLIQQHYAVPCKILICCGAGNNGGDGYLLAALAKQQGYDVVIYQLGDHAALQQPAKTAYLQAIQQNIPLLTTLNSIEADLIVDALFGLGLNRILSDNIISLIHKINQANIPVLSVDLPSGLDANTGQPLGAAIKADITLTFIGVKAGLLTAKGADFRGKLYFSALGADSSDYADITPLAETVSGNLLSKSLVPRQRTAHKGDYGHVLIIGGNHGLGGSAIMTAEAALRCGAGLVSLCTRPEHITAALTRHPEVMAGSQLTTSLLEKATVIVIGPGLGNDRWGQKLLLQALAADKPTVLDADALNYLSALPFAELSRYRRENWVLTPHPGEASRLLQCSTTVIQQDRFIAVNRLQHTFGGVVLLKGHGTLIAAPEQPVRLLACGNPGMASGGMGDVLSGIIGALLAQGLSPAMATACGGWLHASAADILAEKQGERGLLATDLAAEVRKLLNGIQP